MSTALCTCFTFFPAEPHRADLLRKQWFFVAYPPFLDRILKNARPDSFTEGSVSLEDLPWAKCLPNVKYLNRFDSGQRVGRHIRMSWWPLYKLSDLHSTAFMDDFWHVLSFLLTSWIASVRRKYRRCTSITPLPAAWLMHQMSLQLPNFGNVCSSFSVSPGWSDRWWCWGTNALRSWNLSRVPRSLVQPLGLKRHRIFAGFVEGKNV